MDNRIIISYIRRFYKIKKIASSKGLHINPYINNYGFGWFIIKNKKTKKLIGHEYSIDTLDSFIKGYILNEESKK